VEQVLRDIIEGVSNNFGVAFFEKITLKMAEVIGADFTFIARLDKAAYKSRTLALVANNQIVDNIEYSLEHTPCADVSNNQLCMYPNDIVSLYPKDQLLIDMGIEGYIGTPLMDSRGEIMGLTVALYKQPIHNAEFTQTLFQIFSGRISAEIERMEHEANLETEVEQRTAHLEKALIELKRTQKELIKQEKLAGLSGVVAGVAHEINTPLGIAKTAHSLHGEIVSSIIDKFNQNQMTRTDLANYFEQANDINRSISINLERAIDLVQNFKQLSVDRMDDALIQINVAQHITRLLDSMMAEFARVNVSVVTHIPDDLHIVSRGSDLTQVLGNLLINACIHAFDDTENPCIEIEAKAQRDQLQLIVRDNGKGIDPSIRESVFEPFVTTKRNQGGTGLGMNIVYNQVTQALSGHITLNEQHTEGTEWHLLLPIKLDA